MYRNSYVEIDLDALNNNIENIKKEYKEYKYYFGVVKANGYTSGEYIVNEMIKSGINYLTVSSLEEGLSVRKYNKDIPILCFGYIDPKYFKIVEENNITISIISYDYYKSIKKTKNNIKAHLKINTGMNRMGIKNSDEIKEIIDSLKDSNIYLEGIYTHFATTGLMDIYWDKQIKKFEELTSKINLKEIEIIHLYSSTSLERHKKYKYANGVRLGLVMYGFTSFNKSNKKMFNLQRKIKLFGKNISDVILSNNLKLEKILKIYTEVININNLKKGETVGYEAIFKAKKDTKIAVLAIGHADGITSNFKQVKINNKLYNVVAICMDYIMVEVDDEVKMHDKVMIIGDELTIEKVAMNAKDSIHHILVSITNRLPRVYVKNNKKHIVKY